MLLTMLVPVIGYFILFNDSFLAHTSMFGKDMLWKLQFLYFGSCVLSIGLFVFHLRCPRVIKYYMRPSSYCEKESSVLDYHATIRLFEESVVLCRENNLDLSNYFTDNNLTIVSTENDFHQEHKQFLNENHGLDDPGSKYQRLSAYYRIESRTQKKTGILIFFTLIAGLILVSIPTIYTFFEVIGYTANSLGW